MTADRQNNQTWTPVHQMLKYRETKSRLTRYPSAMLSQQPICCWVLQNHLGTTECLVASNLDISLSNMAPFVLFLKSILMTFGLYVHGQCMNVYLYVQCAHNKIWNKLFLYWIYFYRTKMLRIIFHCLWRTNLPYKRNKYILFFPRLSLAPYCPYPAKWLISCLGVLYERIMTVWKVNGENGGATRSSAGCSLTSSERKCRKLPRQLISMHSLWWFSNSCAFRWDQWGY